MTPRDSEILASIAESIRRIDGYVERAGSAWIEDGLALDAIAKRLEQIGELGKRLPPRVVGTHAGRRLEEPEGDPRGSRPRVRRR